MIKIKDELSQVKGYKTVSKIYGPLLFVEKTENISYQELVKIQLSDGSIKHGQVLETSKDYALVQVSEGTSRIDTSSTVYFLGETKKIQVSKDMLGRIFSGSGEPIDGGCEIISDVKLDVNGSPINPLSRSPPSSYIETGISSIDGLNTLIAGQKLPIFSGFGLPHNSLAVQIAQQSNIKSLSSIKEENDFIVIFIAMGISNEEKEFFMTEFINSGSLNKTILFLNLADSSSIERVLTPKIGLTTAEYFAFTLEKNVLVILTDITNYCESLRQISSARNETPGRRGYPSYMYTDLAQIFERCGIIKGKKGSLTMIPIITMPNDDITHPIPDLSGFITEGQILMSRKLNKVGIYPPIDISPSLSRLMGSGIGINKTREDHQSVSDQLYSSYSEGKDLKDLAAIVGEKSFSEDDLKLFNFVSLFENTFVKQGIKENRTIEKTLEIAWNLINTLSIHQTSRISEELLKKYYKKK